MGQLVCCFNSKGDFIKAIGKTGRGPGEYFQATDLVVDAATKHVEVLAPYSRRTYEYSSDGEFIGSKDDGDFPADNADFRRFLIMGN